MPTGGRSGTARRSPPRRPDLSGHGRAWRRGARENGSGVACPRRTIGAAPTSRTPSGTSDQRDRMKMRASIALLALLLTTNGARAEAAPDATPCPGSTDALGTARILPVDAAATPRVGRKHFPQTLALAPKEVVLTFDDGPAAGTTGQVLDALKRECVRASFFLLGRSALAYPELARRAVSESHTVAHHTFSHPLLDRMPPGAAEAEIDRGFAAVDATLYGRSGRVPHTPFSAFPDSPPPPSCSTVWNGVASWCSARTYGRATGIRCRRDSSFSSSSDGSKQIVAELCCFTTPRGRPRRYFRFL